MSKAELYDKRLAMIKATVNHQKPEYVPVISMAQTWAMAYAGEDCTTTFTSQEHEFDVYAKHLLDMNFDGTMLFGMNRPLALYESLGNSAWFFSKDKISIQNLDNMILPENEIDEYIENPLRFLRNKGLYRRYPKLREEFPNNLQALGNGLQMMMAFGAKNQAIPEYLREKVGAPILAGDLMEPTLDRYIGYRTFAEGMSDLRRRPDKVLQALEATYMLTGPAPGPKEDYPYAFFPVVTATYLSPKMFYKFFWPTAKRAMEGIISNGGKVMIALEGKWEHVYECLNELPAHSVIAVLEDDDMIAAKRVIGDKVTLCGGMKVQMLRDGTKQECIDYTKHILDECGHEGIMITQSQGLLSPGDVNPDNMKAVVEFVHEYTC